MVVVAHWLWNVIYKGKNFFPWVFPEQLVSWRLFVGLPGSTNVGEQLPTGQLSVVPWRRTGVKYTNNEAYFDVVEEIDAIIDKSGIPLEQLFGTHLFCPICGFDLRLSCSGSTITAEIQGVIDACVKLTGMPDLTLSFMVSFLFLLLVSVEKANGLSVCLSVRVPESSAAGRCQFPPVCSVQALGSGADPLLHTSGWKLPVVVLPRQLSEVSPLLINLPVCFPPILLVSSCLQMHAWAWLVLCDCFLSLVAIPVYVKHNITFREGSSQGRFDLTLGPKQTMGKGVESVLVSSQLPRGVLNVSLNPSQGTYTFDPVTKVHVHSMKDQRERLSF